MIATKLCNRINDLNSLFIKKLQYNVGELCYLTTIMRKLVFRICLKFKRSNSFTTQTLPNDV